ncbi:MAG: uracil-DNA glycosylase, partial [Nanoarchaeota archaeon]
MGKSEQLDRLRQHIIDSLDCPLKQDATRIVFGKGNPDAQIMFIGEAPGRKEDERGEPFVGAAGRELDKMLRLIDLKTADAYIANILKYRPPNNRNPKKEEILRHTPYLTQQIDIINPRIIAPLGNFATKFVLAGFDPHQMKDIPGISTLHGTKHRILKNGKHYLVIPLYHPA